VVVLFVFFMLLRLDDMSQRFVRLVGYSRLTLTTKAVDEAAERVSRYLLMQVAVNSIYGILLGTGLALLGLPYVVLWGALATVFRFIPYVGPWIVAILPITLSLAVFEGWTLPLGVAGLIVGLELVTNMVLEPLLYGHSAGVSDIALLVAIAFWTWLWGGVGLVLATPLTVCIVVFCKYIPSLEWVDVLMGEKPEVQPHLNYYQHHLANDEGASQALIDACAKKDGIEKAIETLVLPAVALTRFEEAAGKLDPEEASQMYDSMRSAFTMVSENVQSSAKGPEGPPKDPDSNVEGDNRHAAPVKVLGRALQGEADALALEILASALSPRLDFQISAEPLLIGELVKLLEKERPAILCLSALPPRSQFAAGILCRRLQGKLPDLKILVCRWTVPGQEPPAPEPLIAAGATWVASTVEEARAILEDPAGLPDHRDAKNGSDRALP